MPAVALEIKQDATTDSQQLYVRFGTFRDLRNATKLLGGVHQSGLPDKRIKAGKINRKKLYRVQLGPIASANEAEQLLEKVVRLGFTSAQLINDEPDS